MLAAETVDLARVLLDLLVVLAAGKLAAELAERLRVPAVLGEIVAGIAIGPSVLGLVELSGDRGHRGSMTRRRQIRPPLRNAFSPERWA